MRAIGSFISAVYSKLPSYKQTVRYVSSSITSALRALSSLGFLFSSCTRSRQISAVRLSPSKKDNSGVSAVTGAALSVLAPASSGKDHGAGNGGGGMSSSLEGQAVAGQFLTTNPAAEKKPESLAGSGVAGPGFGTAAGFGLAPFGAAGDYDEGLSDAEIARIEQELADSAAEEERAASERRFADYAAELDRVGQQIAKLSTPGAQGPGKLTAEFIASENAFQARVGVQKPSRTIPKMDLKYSPSQERLRVALEKAQHSCAKMKVLGSEYLKAKALLLKLMKSPKFTSQQKKLYKPGLNVKIQTAQQAYLAAKADYERAFQELKSLHRL